MFDYCISPDTSGDGTGCDNMTCVIVVFGDHVAVKSPLPGDLPPTNKRKADDADLTTCGVGGVKRLKGATGDDE